MIIYTMLQTSYHAPAEPKLTAVQLNATQAIIIKLDVILRYVNRFDIEK